jgi:hypothetical protein
MMSLFAERQTTPSGATDVPPTVQKPYWVDEALNKHEAYFYGESASDSRSIAFSAQGRSLTLIVPLYVPEFEAREVRINGEYLFVMGEQIEDEDDKVDQEGYGIILVAKRCPDRHATFWTLIAHDLFPETLEYMTSLPPSRVPTPPAGETDG